MEKVRLSNETQAQEIQKQIDEKLRSADDYGNLDMLNDDYGYLLSLDRLFRG